MSAQVEQVLYINGTLSAHERTDGRLSNYLIYMIRAFGTSTGNPDNEHNQRRRHRCRLSKNLRTIHRSRTRTRDRLLAFVPAP
jgi:hypothetical protein